MRRPLLAPLLLACLSCGGSSSYQDSAARCATPRSGVDPSTNKPYPDQKGSLNDEKTWLKGFMTDLYLWYREIPNVDPSRYSTMDAYFQALKTPQKTASLKLKDQFSFTYPTDQWRALSQSGVEAGYGVTWVTASRTPPGVLYVGDTEPSSPASTAGVTRGMQLVSIDGQPFLDANGVANPGLSPQAIGESHHFVVQDRAGAQKTFDMAAAKVTSVPVKYSHFLPSPNATVGYIFFSKHIATSEQGLVDAINQLKGATDLVLDLRYNGGGYLAIASELAYMIAGPAKTSNVVFEKLAFNDKYPGKDPVTGSGPTPFYTSTNFSSSGAPLPHLDLPRVYILTAGGTCSASEAVINGLMGAGIAVYQIGHTTCGKPYGFYPQDNCGTTYFPIEFQGVNAKGFGDYADGFEPGGTGPAGLPGCFVVDDFTQDLGNPAEGRLAAALQYMSTQTCPARSARPESAVIPAQEEVVGRSPLFENRWMSR